MLKHINNSEEFKDFVKQDKLVLVDFFATWCGPCQMLAPVLTSYCDEHPEFDIAKLDVDMVDSVAVDYQIFSVPSLLFFKNGVEVKRHIGFISAKALADLIQSLK